MFDTLSDRLEGVFKKLKGQGRITERNIEDALREVRLALLEADVNIKVVRDFIENVKSKALGAEVLRSLSPEQHLIKFVATELQNAMGGTARELDLKVKPPVKIMVCGLQGAGKTTSIAKLARWLKSERRRHPLLASTEVYRPAAMEQLRVLGAQAPIPVLDPNEQQDPIEIASRAMARAETGGHDAILIDTAGRLQIDEELMDELARLKAALNPHHIIFVADAMTGQEAATVAAGFHERLNISGVILTKLDSDARGGAALSVRTITGAPILFAATSEKLDGFEIFYPDRLTSSILGMGDVLTLIKKMGSLGELMGMIPGLKKLAGAADSEDAKLELGRIQAIIDSMTLQERGNHLIINGRRRARIAGGSGTSVQDVNRFLKQFEQTRKMMKKITRMGAGKMMMRGLGLGS